MRGYALFGLALILPACTSENAGAPQADASQADASQADASQADAGGQGDSAGSTDATTNTQDSGDALQTEAASDAQDNSDGADGASDEGAQGACPASWLARPAVDPSIAIPADAGGVVIVHASASGTQNYACAPGTDGGFAWKLVAPDAVLSDCHAAIGHHFASEAGATSPEWLLDDGSYAIGRRVAAFVPDGGAGSIPWLLLQVAGQSDAGVLSQATYVQRLNTGGGVAPTAVCGTDSGTAMVSYTADYYFYGH
jgi:hypothetical protein